MKLSHAIDEYLSAKQNSVAHKTYVWYSQRLLSFAEYSTQVGMTNTEDITITHVQNYVASLPYTNTYTVHGCIQVVKGFLAWCAMDGGFAIREGMVRRIELSKIEQSDIHLFSHKDIDKLLRACTRRPFPLRSSAIVHVLLDTGIRVSELAWDCTRPNEGTGLKMANVILDRDADSSIRVVGKGRKPRALALGKETRLALTRYISKERPDDLGNGFVFLSRRGEPMGVRMVQQFITDLGGYAGVSPCYPHLFRHTFAVNCLLNGVSDLVLMRLMGHTSLEATKLYVRGLSEVQAMQLSPSVVDTIKRPKKEWT